MSTQKIDPVVEELKKYVEMNDDDAGKFMLYANPNGSGLLNEKAPLLPVMQAKFAHAAQTGVFDYDGLELPISAVGIQVRVRHTIHELLQLLELANIMRAHLYVASAKGQIWPAPLPEVPGQPATSEKKTSMKIPVIKGVKSAIKEELVKNLPTIIDLCYTAKFRSGGTFSYSLAETKLYSIKQPFLTACFNWIYQILGVGSGSPNDLIAGTAGARENLLYEDWYSYSYSKSRDTHKYPQHTTKLFRAICARVGKLLFTAPGSDDYDSHGVTSATGLLGELGFSYSQDTKKKTLQKDLYKFLLKTVQTSHEAASVNSSDNFSYRRNVISSIDIVLEPLIRHVDGLGIERSLVFLDVFLQRDQSGGKKSGYTNQDFVEIAKVLSATGACNERVMNALYKFISVHSLLHHNGHSRKFLDQSIELALVQHADLSKIKPGSPDPNIVFSQHALSVMSPTDRLKFEHLRDFKLPSATGYVQKGVMSMTSSLKEDKPINPTVNHDEYKLRGNQLNELANIYDDISQPSLKQQKDLVKKITQDKKLRAKYQIGGVSPYQMMGSAFVPQAQSPAPVNQAAHSPSNKQGGGLFGGPASGRTSPAPVTEPSEGLFGRPLNLGGSLHASPLSKPSGGLFGDQANLGGSLHASPLSKPSGGLFGNPLNLGSGSVKSKSPGAKSPSLGSGSIFNQEL